MRFLVQRVLKASVSVDHIITGSINAGLLVLIGIATNDKETDADYLADKLIHLRIMADSDGHMNRSVMDTQGGLLLISQFTLYGDCRKGRRPSFSAAAPAEQARGLYEYTVARLRQSRLTVETGVFQADMKVELVNDGPVTLMLESER